MADLAGGRVLGCWCIGVYDDQHECLCQKGRGIGRREVEGGWSGCGIARELIACSQFNGTGVRLREGDLKQSERVE